MSPELLARIRERDKQAREPLRTECAWCGALIHDGKLPVSHGLCPQCAETHFREPPRAA